MGCKCNSVTFVKVSGNKKQYFKTLGLKELKFNGIKTN